jgi:hypothetical protein
MSKASEALDVLRAAGLKVTTERTHIKEFSLAERLGTMELCESDDGMFSFALGFESDQPVIVIRTEEHFPRRQEYFLASFILCLARGRNFYVQMLEGEESERISLRDVARIVERAMTLLGPIGEINISFSELDTSIPF